jgi:hypothetical protein
MDYVTRQFINLTKKFRKDLRLSISELTKETRKQTEAICSATKTTHPQQSPPEIASLINSVETVKSSQNATQQDSSRWQRRNFWVQFAGVAILLAYTVFTGLMYCANKKSANAAKSAADTAARQLELAERPWVDANVAIDGPLSWDINGGNMALKVAMRNTGHSPALSVGIWPSVLIGTKGANAVNYRPEACSTAEKMSNLGVALFPNTNFEQPESVTINKDTIENEKASKEFPGSNFGEAILSPTIVICIAYRPAFKSGTTYHTAYIFDLLKRSAAGLSPVFKIGENVDAKYLLLRLHPFKAISVDEP